MEDFDDEKVLGPLTIEQNREVSWSYSSKAFDYLRRQVEQETAGQWCYSGESDLLMLDAHKMEGGWKLDFRRTISISLWHALNDKAIDTVPILLENIIRCSEKYGFHGIWEWSDRQLVDKGSSAFIEGLISLLPSPLKDVWKKGRHFAVT